MRNRLAGALISLARRIRRPHVINIHNVHVEAGKDAGENFADELRRQQAAQDYMDTTR